jgi:catechol 2,3-dioxygenase-like lactoylglutathione lyase family enzyme
MIQPVAEPKPATPTAAQDHDGVVTVRYQVADIERSIGFYTSHLGFQDSERFGSAFAAVVRGPLRLILSGPGSSGSRTLPDGREQQPGGWNRIVLYVDDLAQKVEALGREGVTFRGQVESGPGGSQILIEDPDGNPIELHQPPSR